MPRLHVLTPDRTGATALAAVEQVLEAGAPAVQIRLKQADDDARLAFIARVRAATAKHGARCIVNDRVDLALASGADGVHLGAHDLPVSAARRILDTTDGTWLVGGTAREPETARRLVDEGADYLGVGPCFATASKTGLPEPGGPARIAAVAAAVEVPVIAIGGVTADRVPELMDAGAHGVAVIGAVFDGPESPPAATRQLLEVLGEGSG